jgi:hypothetical protein
MKEFVGGVGGVEGVGGVGAAHTSGVWSELPVDHPEFRERYQGQLAKLAKARKSEEMI